MRSTIVGLVVALLLVGGVTGADAAKRCRRLCRAEVRACIGAARARIACAGLTGHARRDCRRELNAAVRTCKSMRGPVLAACKASTSTDTCSPSGAFVEE